MVSNLADSKVDNTIVAAASKNKVEFDLRKNEWLAKTSKTSSVDINPFGESSSHACAEILVPRSKSRSNSNVTKSLRSFKTLTTKSTALSNKRVDAQLELKIAQLEADHLKDRIEEQSIMMALEREQKMQMH